MGIFSLALCQGAGVTPLFGTPRPVAVTHLPQRSPETFEETPRDLEGTIKPWEKSLYHLFVFSFLRKKIHKTTENLQKEDAAPKVMPRIYLWIFQTAEGVFSCPCRSMRLFCCGRSGHIWKAKIWCRMMAVSVKHDKRNMLG